MAFQRMMACHSTPRLILSDNAAEYVRADKELKALMEAISSLEVRKKLGEKGIEWRFVPALSPSHNGVSEVLIKGAKNALYKIFQGKLLTESELTTAIKLAQGQMNMRPLICITDDKDDGNLLTLTPSHLLLGKPLVALPSSFDIEFVG